MKRKCLIFRISVSASVLVFALFLLFGNAANGKQSPDPSFQQNRPGSNADLQDTAGLERKLQDSVISLNVQDVSASEILKMISKLSGVPIQVKSPLNSDQKLTLALQDAPVLDALKMVAGMADLEYALVADGIEVSQK